MRHVEAVNTKSSLEDDQREITPHATFMAASVFKLQPSRMSCSQPLTPPSAADLSSSPVPRFHPLAHPRWQPSSRPFLLKGHTSAGHCHLQRVTHASLPSSPMFLASLPGSGMRVFVSLEKEPLHVPYEPAGPLRGPTASPRLASPHTGFCCSHAPPHPAS